MCGGRGVSDEQVGSFFYGRANRLYDGAPWGWHSMRVVKNINNNVCICLDSRNNEVVAFGRGIGFIKPPREVPLSQVDRTFYNVTEQQIELLGSIPQDVLTIATQVIDLANRSLGDQFRSNVVFTLADHLNFTIERYRQGIIVKLPFYYEVEQLYPDELAVGKEALEFVRTRLGIRLPREEASAIALHLVNYESVGEPREQADRGAIIEKCTAIIERESGVKVDRDGYAYYRFVMHMHRLLRDAQAENPAVDGADDAAYDAIRTQYPTANRSAQVVATYLGDLFEKELSEQELLYLTLHINLLCSRSQVAGDDAPVPTPATRQDPPDQ